MDAPVITRILNGRPARVLGAGAGGERPRHELGGTRRGEAAEADGVAVADVGGGFLGGETGKRNDMTNDSGRPAARGARRAIRARR